MSFLYLKIKPKSSNTKVFDCKTKYTVLELNILKLWKHKKKF